MKSGKKVIIFTSEDWHFYAHLLPIGVAAKVAGYEVKVITRITAHKELIENKGLQVLSFPIDRFSLNPFKELITILRVIKILKQEKPDILHNFGIKPILYGSIAGYWCKTKKVVNTFLGMGYVFISQELWVKVLRFVFLLSLRWLMKRTNSIIITQNQDDANLLIEHAVTTADHIYAKCSVGIDTTEFQPLKELPGRTRFALVGRMIWDKGIGEFVEAAKILKGKGVDADFFLVGDPDPENLRSVSLDKLREWEQQGVVKWLGYSNDIKKVWESAHVAVLPSYREGLSRSLLEAAAYERALITTDVPGCRELVADGVNGLLVQVRDVESLANAMEKLTLDKALRIKLAQKARKIVIRDYDAQKLANGILEYYKAR